jgi:hypothetical protein
MPLLKFNFIKANLKTNLDIEFNRTLLKGRNESNDVFEKLLDAINKSGEDAKTVSELIRTIEALRSNQNSPSFSQCYKDFVSLLADNITVFGSIVGPYLPIISTMLN